LDDIVARIQSGKLSEPERNRLAGLIIAMTLWADAEGCVIRLAAQQAAAAERVSSARKRLVAKLGQLGDAEPAS
jgi:hypothetical protein